MVELRYTLVADGPSDRALIPIINWVLIPEYVEDFSPLRRLSSFRRLETDVERLAACEWRVREDD